MLFKYLKKYKEKIGEPPGSLIHLEEKPDEELIIELFEYNPEQCNQIEFKDYSDISRYLKSENITWLDINGKPSSEFFDIIQNDLKINILTLEDILNTSLYPKTEFFDDYIFSILKKIDYDIDSNSLEIKNIGIITGKKFLITFQESASDLYKPIKKLLLKNSAIRKRGSDYLLYSLIDLTVDYEFHTLDLISEKSEIIEDKLVKSPNEDILIEINDLKKNISLLKSLHKGFKDIINTIKKADSELVSTELLLYFRDIEDHLVQIIELTELFREETGHLKDFYFSSLNTKMSEIMKVLTIIATIFIPLTFLAGIYGMNFKYMPELKWHYGYFSLLFFMAMIFITMILFFKQKKWL